ncbi:hypothetical protein AAMO2058_000624200 [Amorphochlora amoebiformis]
MPASAFRAVGRAIPRGIRSVRRMTSGTPSDVIPAAVAVLEQQRIFVSGMTCENYMSQSMSTESSIGGHVRHSLDHYKRLLEGGTSDTIVEFDSRIRGTDVEFYPDAAIEEIESLKDTINSLGDKDLLRPVECVFLIDGEGKSMKFQSNFLRELWFVTHHAIHHNAIMKVIAQELILDEIIPDEFGMAPSTLNFIGQRH